MSDTTSPRLTLLQRWHRLRTSSWFPYVVFLGLLVAGAVSQVSCYWWSVCIEEMLARNGGNCERIAIYQDWMKQYLGQKFVRRLEPIRQVNLRVGLFEENRIRSDDLRLLRGAPFLEELNLGYRLTPEDVWYLKWLRGLKTVRFYKATEAVPDAIEWLPALNNLMVSFEEPFPNTTFELIAGLPRLERLTCYFGDKARRDSNVALAYEELRRAARLKRLCLAAMNRAEFAALLRPLPDGSPPFPELRELQIVGTHKVGPDDLDPLVNLPSLIHLDLSYGSISDAHLSHLKRIPNLRTLYLESNPNITDEGAKVLASMTQLQTLNIKATGIGSDGRQLIAKLPRLRCLRVHMGLEERTAARKLLPPGCELDTN